MPSLKVKSGTTKDRPKAAAIHQIRVIADLALHQIAPGHTDGAPIAGTNCLNHGSGSAINS
jgi:hypothetical protein